jgi:hypothetical protein
MAQKKLDIKISITKHCRGEKFGGKKSSACISLVHFSSELRILAHLTVSHMHRLLARGCNMSKVYEYASQRVEMAR